MSQAVDTFAAGTPRGRERWVSRELPIRRGDPAAPADSPAEALARLLTSAEPDARERARLVRSLPSLLARACKEHDPASLYDLHRMLYVIYDLSFAHPLAPAAVHEHSAWLVEIRQMLEAAWMGHEEAAVARELPPEDVQRSPDGMCAWFEAQARREADLDRSVVRHLAERATRAQFERFVMADALLNYRFYDALALAQLHLCETVKTEISHHMWDECGGGDGRQAHTVQFGRALEKLGLPEQHVPFWSDWRPYAGFNLYLLFGLNRRYHFRALGSLAMPELFDPGRDRAVCDGLDRLGYRAREEFEYYYNHMVGDEEHGSRWLSDVIRPIVARDADASIELARGGAMRMVAMRRYNEYLVDLLEIPAAARVSS